MTVLRPPPTTFELVEALALRHPGRPALREDGREFDYGQLYAMLLQAHAQLRRLGIEAGARVAVSGPGFVLQMVLLLAAESVGAVTVSFAAEKDPDAGFLFTQVDWVLSGRPQEVPAGVRFVLLDAGFLARLQQAFNGDRPALAPPAMDAPQRIVRTSGSSGPSKFMLLRRSAQEWWIRLAHDTWEMGSTTRLLLICPLVVNAGFARACACLRRGGLVGMTRPADLAGMDPTHILGLPLQLDQLLQQLPADYAPPRPVTVATFGGMATPSLRRRAQRRFGGEVHNRYGSNEAAAICHELDATGAGVLFAGVDVRILDEAGHDLPVGQPGVIAVRSPAVAEAYLGLPQESAAAFRDGWFVSGDVGMLVGPRRLRLLGRQDGLVIVGGVKLPAEQVEERIRAQSTVEDCAVQAVNLEEGAVTLGLALVLAPGATRDAALKQLQQSLRLPSDTAVRLLVLEALPRTQAGKLDRMELLRLFQQPG